jgi:two-component sensor histidine kinase
LAPFIGGDSGRLALIGGSLRAPARLTLALSLVFHELATNAAKHGAWRNAAGCVEVSFALERGGAGESLRLRWRERSGEGSAEAYRQGFGVNLIRQVVEYQFDGEARMEMLASGVQWDIAVPWPSPG